MLRIRKRGICVLEEVLKHVINFLYIISFLIGVSGITLAILLAKRYESELYKWLLAFVLTFFLYEVTNFIVFYRAIFVMQWEINVTIVFLSDICLVALLYSWVELIGRVASVEVKNKLFDNSFKFFSIMYVLVGILTYLYGMEQDYNLTTWGKVSIISMDSIVSLFAIGGSSFYLAKGLKVADQVTKRVLLILVTAMYLFIFLFYNEDLYLILNFVFFDSFDIYAIEPVTVLYLLLSILFIIYVFNEELLIKAKEPDRALRLDWNGEGKLTIVAIGAQYGLTEREKEVLLMVYEGHSNLKIAELLCISPFTVKRHINNIFRKTAVKTRVELIHLLITAQ